MRAVTLYRLSGLAVLVGMGSVAAVVMSPLVSVPSGPFRLDRVGVLAAALAFAWCGYHLLRDATAAGDRLPESRV